MNYARAGVDRSGVRDAHRLLADRLASTFATRKGRIGHPLFPIGHYAGIVDLGRGNVLTLHTDSVGTKVLVAFAMEKFDTIGIDCVAMCANDLICTGSEPISFLDYMAMAKPDHELVDEVAKGLVKGAKEAEMAIVGGELAIVPELLASQEHGFDLVGIGAGYCRKDNLILGDKIKQDDVLLGVASTGIHSNGLTLARKVLIGKYEFDEKPEFLERTLGTELLEPTRIYVKPMREVLEKVHVHGLAHVTGGAFSKLNRILAQSGFGASLDNMPSPPGIFKLIEQTGHISRKEMYQTFNMGIGLVVFCSKDDARKANHIFARYGFNSMVIGRVQKRQGVWLENTNLA